MKCDGHGNFQMTNLNVKSQANECQVTTIKCKHKTSNVDCQLVGKLVSCRTGGELASLHSSRQNI